jgi:hypothetical protein
MLNIINNLYVFDYLANIGVILSLFYISEHDLKKQSFKFCWKILKNVTLLFFFFILTLYFEYSKNYTLLFCIVLSFLIIFIEKNYLKYI